MQGFKEIIDQIIKYSMLIIIATNN